ncbi:MAG TPA: hypothetical protein DCX07_10675 [Phycisphaerales bacterium]|nr:hypothetical protein [Phycisphaerales bacterium]
MGEKTNPCTGTRRRVDGFTLIELLVVIAILALLVSILMPSLAKARDLARVTICKTNLHQHGYAYHMYSSDWNGLLPMWRMGTQIWPNPTVYSFQNLLAPYLGFPQDFLDTQTGRLNVYYNSKSSEMAAQIAVFRCPSIEGVRTRNNLYDANHSYFQNVAWDMPGFYGSGTCYRESPQLANFQRAGDAILLSDLWQRQMEGNSNDDAAPYNAHSSPEGRNVLYVDSHVTFLGRDGYDDEITWPTSGQNIKNTLRRVY